MNLANVAAASQRKPAKKASRSYKKQEPLIKEGSLSSAEPLAPKQDVSPNEQQFYTSVAKGFSGSTRGFTPEVKESVAANARDFPEQSRRGLTEPAPGMPDNVRRNIMGRIAQGSVPAYLHDPANWPEDLKQKLTDPDSDEAKLASYDQSKYGMPTFGYVSDPEREQYAKQVRLSREPGTVYSEAKAMDARLKELGMNPTPEQRHDLIGVMWLRNGMKSDSDPVTPGSGKDIADMFANVDSAHIHQLVEQGRARRFSSSLSRGEKPAPQDIASASALSSGSPVTGAEAARLMGPTGGTGNIQLASGATAGSDPQADLQRWLSGEGPLSVSRETALGGFREAYGVGSYEKEMGLPAAGDERKFAANVGLTDTRQPTDFESALRESGTDPHSFAGTIARDEPSIAEADGFGLYARAFRAVLPSSLATTVRQAAGVAASEQGMTEQVSEAALNSIGGLFEAVALGNAGAAIIGAKAGMTAAEASQAAKTASLIAKGGKFFTGYVAQQLPSMAVALQQNNYDVGKTVAQTAESMAKGFNPSTLFDPNTPLPEKVSSGINQAFLAIGVTVHGLSKISALKEKIPEDIEPAAFKAEVDSMPPEIALQVERVRQEILRGLVEANGHKLEDAHPALVAGLDRQAQSAAIVLARAASHIESQGGQPALDSMQNVTYRPSSGLVVPPEIEQGLNDKGVSTASGKKAPEEVYTFTAMHSWDPELRTGLIQLGPEATIAEVAHETAHYVRRILPEKLLTEVQESLGLKEWNREAEERFARAFEMYLTQKGGEPGLEPVMARLALAVRDIYASDRLSGGRRSYLGKKIGREPTAEDSLQFHAEPTIGEGKLVVPDDLGKIFDEMTSRPSEWPGMLSAVMVNNEESTDAKTVHSDEGQVRQPGDEPREGPDQSGEDLQQPSSGAPTETGQEASKPEVRQVKEPWQMPREEATTFIRGALADAEAFAKSHTPPNEQWTSELSDSLRKAQAKYDKLRRVWDKSSMPDERLGKELRDAEASLADIKQRASVAQSDNRANEDFWKQKERDYLLSKYPGLFESRDQWPFVMGSDRYSEYTLSHKDAVKAALREGKPVPPEVLADYPDLAKNDPRFALKGTALDADSLAKVGWKRAKSEGYNGNAAPLEVIAPDGTVWQWKQGMAHGGAEPWVKVGKESDGYEAVAPKGSASRPTDLEPKPQTIMDQWQRAKDAHPDALVAMRIGDFYEFYGDDAKTVADTLGITLTGREVDGARIPMSGVPYHSLEKYIAKLVESGKKVALVDHIEDPKAVRGRLVERGVTRVEGPPEKPPDEPSPFGEDLTAAEKAEYDDLRHQTVARQSADKKYRPYTVSQQQKARFKYLSDKQQSAAWDRVKSNLSSDEFAALQDDLGLRGKNSGPGRVRYETATQVLQEASSHNPDPEAMAAFRDQWRMARTDKFDSVTDIVSALDRQSPFGEDEPAQRPLSKQQDAGRAHFEEKGLPPAVSGRAARGVFGNQSDRAALVADQEALDALGKAYGFDGGISPGIAHSLLDRIGEIAARQGGFKWKPEVPEAPPVAGEVVPNDLASGQRMFRMKSERVIDEKMRGPMDIVSFVSMLRNNGVKAAEIESLEKFRPSFDRISPEQAREWVSRTRHGVYGERTYGTDFEKFMSDADKVEMEANREAAKSLEPKMKEQSEQLTRLKNNMLTAIKRYVQSRGLDKIHDEMSRLKSEAYKALVKHDDLGFDDTDQAYSALWSHYASHGNFENWDITPSDARIIQDSIKFNQSHANEEYIYRASTGETGYDFFTKDLFPLSHSEIEWAKAAREKTVRKYSSYYGAAHSFVDRYSPKWPSYVVKPAGTNYREIVIRAPEYGDSRSHFSDMPDYDSHVRVSDRTIDGKSTTFIEELQSDRHQEARKRGGYTNDADIAAARAKYEEASLANREAIKAFNIANQMTGDDPAIRAEAVRLYDRKDETERLMHEAGIALSAIEDKPLSTPFCKNWEEVAFRRTLFDAATAGHDQIGWTAGDVHAERYREFSHDDGRSETASERNARRARGFQAAYDERLVNIANDIGKRYGVRAEQTTVEGKPAWKMDIPPKMAEDIADGQDLFSGERMPPVDDLDPDIQEMLDQPAGRASWAKRAAGTLHDLRVAGARTFSDLVSELNATGGRARDAGDKIYNAWMFGRRLSADYRFRLEDAVTKVYAQGLEHPALKALRNGKVNRSRAEIADTERAVLERWDDSQRRDVLAKSDEDFDAWVESKPKIEAREGETAPTLNQVRLWREWGKIAEETAHTAWSNGIGVWRVAGPDMAELDPILRGKEVRYILGGGKADKAGVLEKGVWVGWDEGKNVGLVMGEDGQIRQIKPGDVFSTPSLLKGMEFFPKRLTDAAKDALADPNSPMYRHEIARRMKQGMSKETAEKLLRASIEPVTVNIPGRVLTRIEMPRLPGDFPPDFYEHDFTRVADQHLDQTAKRVAQAQFMGPDMGDLAADLAEAAGPNRKLLEGWASKVQAAFGHGVVSDSANTTARKAASGYGAFKAITALGTGKTAIKQLGSIASTAGIHGYLATVRSLFSTLNPAWWDTVHRLGPLDVDYAKLHGMDFSGAAKETASKVLKYTGVTTVDQAMRVNAASAGIIGTKLAIQKLATIPEAKWAGTRHYRYLHDWGKFTDAEIGKMVQRAAVNKGAFDFKQPGMEPMYTKAAFAGVQTQGITDPVNYPEFVSKNPVVKGLMTLNNFYYLQSKIFGHAAAEAGRGNIDPLLKMMIAGTAIGSAVMAGISKLEKAKQLPFWFAWFKHQGQADAEAWENASNAAGARGERPGFRHASDVDWQDWASGNTIKQIASAVAEGLDATGLLGMYGGFLDAVRPDDQPMGRTAFDRVQSAVTGLAPAPLKDITAPFAQFGAAQQDAKEEEDRAMKKGAKEKIEPPQGMAEQTVKGTLEQVAPIPLIGGGVYRKPAAWKLAFDTLSDENARLARRYGAYPQPRQRPNETTEDFLGRVKAKAENWNVRLDQLREAGLRGDDLRQAVLNSAAEAFRSARRTYSR